MENKKRSKEKAEYKITEELGGLEILNTKSRTSHLIATRAKRRGNTSKCSKSDTLVRSRNRASLYNRTHSGVFTLNNQCEERKE